MGGRGKIFFFFFFFFFFVGTTWVFTVPRLEWKGDSELNVKYIVDFALGNYKLKIRENEPYRLLFDPNDQFSVALWRLTSWIPSINLSQFGELMQLRKNAVAIVVGAGVVVGFVLHRLVMLLFCRRRKR